MPISKFRQVYIYNADLIGIKFRLFSNCVQQWSLVVLTDLPSTLCGVCKQIFCGMEKLQRHMQTHFIGDNNVNTTTATNNVKGAARPIVTKVKLTNNNQSYECKFCGRTFQKGSAMKMHIDKVHMTDVKKEVKEVLWHRKRGKKPKIKCVCHVFSFSILVLINYKLYNYKLLHHCFSLSADFAISSTQRDFCYKTMRQAMKESGDIRALSVAKGSTPVEHLW